MRVNRQLGIELHMMPKPLPDPARLEAKIHVGETDNQANKESRHYASKCKVTTLDEGWLGMHHHVFSVDVTIGSSDVMCRTVVATILRQRALTSVWRHLDNT